MGNKDRGRWVSKRRDIYDASTARELQEIQCLCMFVHGRSMFAVALCPMGVVSL